MKHYIIAKFLPSVDQAAQLPRIREIFAQAPQIPGVHGAEIRTNCVARDNRCDLMIVLDMDREALPNWDASDIHHRWKDEYGGLLEQKAIFDYE